MKIAIRDNLLRMMRKIRKRRRKRLIRMRGLNELIRELIIFKLLLRKIMKFLILRLVGFRGFLLMPHVLHVILLMPEAQSVHLAIWKKRWLVLPKVTKMLRK